MWYLKRETEFTGDRYSIPKMIVAFVIVCALCAVTIIPIVFFSFTVGLVATAVDFTDGCDSDISTINIFSSYINWLVRGFKQISRG